MRLRAHHWLLAFALALFAHLLLFLSQQEALLEPPKLQFRGGGLVDEGGDNPDSGGVLVTLGRLGETPGDAPEEVATSPQPPEEAPPPEPSQPEAIAVPEPEPEPEPAPEPEPEPEVTEEAPVEPAPEPEEPTEIAALPEPTPEPEPAEEVPPPPIPLRKPEPPRPEPQLEVVERRLPVQAPAQTAPAEPQPPAEPDAAQAPSEPLVAAELPIVPGRIGDASGNETGLVPRLNYEQRVLLWLKRNGNYPRDSYRYNQEGVVLLEFTIDRSGRILSYDILESSGYHLLDRAVHEMMARASPVPPMPDSIPEQQMRFKVPVRFERG